MPLFRLDYIDTNGKVTGPVRGRDIGVLTLAASSDDILVTHMQTARRHALDAARRAECDVQIAGIIKGGIIKPRLIVRPDGSASKPHGTRAGRTQDECKRDSGERCFCPACRAERRRR
jgi:hypothetical protein